MNAWKEPSRLEAIYVTSLGEAQMKLPGGIAINMKTSENIKKNKS